MAMLMKNSRVGVPSTRSASSRPVVSVRAAADRPLWFPGNPAPAHLDGT